MNMVILAEKQVNYIHKDHKDPFHLPMASVWVLNDNGEMTCRKNGPDVYELLDSPDTLKAIKGADLFFLKCCIFSCFVGKFRNSFKISDISFII